MSLQEHVIEVKILVGLAYAELPDESQQQMALETFYNALGNAYLQRYLLAVETYTIAGYECLQIWASGDRVQTAGRNVGGREKDSEIVIVDDSTIRKFRLEMKNMSDRMEQLQKQNLFLIRQKSKRNRPSKNQLLGMWE